MNPGRPSKFSPHTTGAIVKAIREGNTRRVAAACAGIGRTTLKNWIARGRREKTGPYRAFVAAIKKADAQAEALFLGVIRRAAFWRTEVTEKKTKLGDGTEKSETTSRRVFDWYAAAWYLERTRPDVYSRDARELRELRKRVEEIEARANGAADAGAC